MLFIFCLFLPGGDRCFGVRGPLGEGTLGERLCLGGVGASRQAAAARAGSA